MKIAFNENTVSVNEEEGKKANIYLWNVWICILEELKSYKNRASYASGTTKSCNIAMETTQFRQFHIFRAISVASFNPNPDDYKKKVWPCGWQSYIV